MHLRTPSATLRIVALSFVCALCFLSTPRLYAQAPTNDSCSTAIVVTSLTDTIRENTRTAAENTSDPGIPCASDSNGQSGKSVWFTFTADSSRWLTFSTTGSANGDSVYDTAEDLFTGSCGDLTLVACNDDIVQGSIRTSAIDFYVQKGTTYYVFVGEWDGGGSQGGHPTGGDLVFHIDPSGPPPPIVLGPKSANTKAGAMQSTNGFSNAPVAFHQGQEEHDAAENPEVKLLPAPKNMRKPAAPEGANFFKDKTRDKVQTTSISQPVMLKNFAGYDETGYIPPDPIGAMGPTAYITMVNSGFKIFDRSGTTLKTIDLNAWFNDVTNNTTEFSDPQVVYDQLAGRWVMTGLNITDSTILFSVSADSNPIGTWYNWEIPAERFGDSVTVNFPDQPMLGYDDSCLYITTRSFNPGFAYTALVYVPKSQAYSNTTAPLTFTNFWGFQDPENPGAYPDGLRPSKNFGHPSAEFLVNFSPFSPGTYLTLWTLRNPVSNPTITGQDISITQYSGAPGNSQPGSNSPTIDGGGSGLNNTPVYRDSSLWVVHSIASGSVNSAIQYVRVNPFTGLRQEDVQFGGTNYWYSYPALMVNAAEDLVITYTRSSMSEDLGAFFTGRRAGDPPGLAPSVAMRTGSAVYTQSGGGRYRWGDYNGISLDPADSTSIYANTEYVEPGASWGTWVGQVRIAPVPGKSIFSQPPAFNYTIQEIGKTGDTLTFFFANYGEDSLTISSLSVTDTNFVILNAPATPLKLGSLASDTLKVVFSPHVRGTYAGNVRILSDDPNNPETDINLTAIGFSITPAQVGTLYGVSSVTGDLATVNVATGAATVVAGTGYPGMTNVRVNPVTRELIGFDPTRQFVRISSDLADGHPLVQTAQLLPTAQGLSFRNDTMYLGQRIGKVFRVDPVTGNTTMVDSTGLGIGGMDFNPLTGQLWIGIGIGAITDGIYKVNIPGGHPVLVGETHLGTGVTDLMFDGAGNLYGVISSFGNASLVKIDTSTGAGHVVGPMGVQGLAGIGMIPDTLLTVAGAVFDSTDLNTSKADTILIHNPGGSTVSITGSSTTDPGEFSVSPSSGSIPPSGSIPVYVTFSPLSVGTKTAVALLTLNGQQNGAINLDGFAVAPATRTTLFGSYWNLVSVPLVVPDYHRSLLYPTASSGAFSFNGGYVQQDSLVNGVGYWLQFTNAQSVAIGGYLGGTDTFAVGKGWNLIGSTPDSVLTSALRPLGTRIKSVVWGYQAGYQMADTLFPGRGYWLEVDSAGKLILPPPVGGASPKAKPSAVAQTLAGLTTLHLEDAAGLKQTLYYGLRTGKEGDDALYDMPPVAPRGVFDARYGSNHAAEFIDKGASNKIPIQLSGAKYPVRITWNVKATTLAGTLTLNGREIPLSATGSVDVLSSQSVLSLTLKGSKPNLPVAYALEQNFPNPFNPTTHIAYSLPKDSKVSLRIYDVLGREIATLVNEQQTAGYKSVEWNSTSNAGLSVPSGVYFYRIQAGSFSQTKKLLLLK